MIRRVEMGNKRNTKHDHEEGDIQEQSETDSEPHAFGDRNCGSGEHVEIL